MGSFPIEMAVARLTGPGESRTVPENGSEQPLLDTSSTAGATRSGEEEARAEKTAIPCNICGGTTFREGPGQRLSTTNLPPMCESCGSLERHRVFRAIFNQFRKTSNFKSKTALMFSKDCSVAGGWFRSMRYSVFGTASSLDVQEIAEPDGAFDVVVCNHILEHVARYEAALKEIGRVLSPLGFAFVSFPSPHHREVTLDWGYPKPEMHGHYRIFGADIEDKLPLLLPEFGILRLVDKDPVTGTEDRAYLFSRDHGFLGALTTKGLNYQFLRAPAADFQAQAAEQLETVAEQPEPVAEQPVAEQPVAVAKQLEARVQPPAPPPAEPAPVAAADNCEQGVPKTQPNLKPNGRSVRVVNVEDEARMADGNVTIDEYGTFEERVSREVLEAPGTPSKITLGLRALLRDNPWPEFIYGEIEPFQLALDNNGRSGRELIIDLIRDKKISLMVEIGSFLCGSTLHWLRASDKLTVIGVDPWDGNWAAYISRMATDPVRSRNVWHLSDAQHRAIVTNLRRYGNFCMAMNNVRLYKSRFYPVRRRSPEALAYLRARDITPELIYIDAGKHREDLDSAHKLFPNAVLCGDDWLWPDETGVLRMQENVKAFAAEHGFDVRASRQTWVLTPPVRPLEAAPA